MIKEAYVSLEIARLLKEKGFNEVVHHEYHYTISIPQFHRKPHNFNGDEYANCNTKWYSAPTHQMVMAWMREMYGTYIVFFHTRKSGWWYNITDMDTSYVLFSSEKMQCSYEEAVEAAIKYCLKNLI